MSKKKKKKQKPNKPQLSKLDKFTYTSLLLISYTAVHLIILNSFQLLNKLYFLDNIVIAATPRLTIILSLPFFLIIFITPMWKIIESETKHKAIFGNKNVDYRKYSSVLRPIFGKERNKVFTEKQNKKLKNKIIFWSVTLIALFLISIPGLLGRELLTSDGRIIVYSVFNNVKEEYKTNNISKVEYSAYYSSGGRYSPNTYDYSIEIHILNSDKSFSFDNQSFKRTSHDNISQSLTEMIRLKEEVYKDKIITFDLRTDLREIAEYNKFNEQETALLYNLFEREE